MPSTAIPSPSTKAFFLKIGHKSKIHRPRFRFGPNKSKIYHRHRLLALLANSFGQCEEKNGPSAMMASVYNKKRYIHKCKHNTMECHFRADWHV